MAFVYELKAEGRPPAPLVLGPNPFAQSRPDRPDGAPLAPNVVGEKVPDLDQ